MDDLIKQNRSEILRVAARHGAGNVRIFGSRATGKASSTSDIDLLVDIVAEPSPWFPGGLIADLEQLLRCRVDVGTTQELHPAIRDWVLREARPL